MWYSPEAKAVFIHIFKCGGTSVTHWLNENIDNTVSHRAINDITHPTGIEVFKHLRSRYDNVNEWKWFCGIRNPFDRWVSIVRHANKHHGLELDDKKIYEFYKNYKRGLSVQGQFKFIHINDIKINLFDVSLEGSFEMVQKYFGCSNTLEKLNVNDVDKHPIDEKFIKMYFANDIVNYNHFLQGRNVYLNGTVM